ncbi:MAG: 2-keto-3-deoxy-L-fuconate dehydrogenase [Kiritimatiellia bacterium]|jgi:2-keto-3-deoxy-L-fuconate dehydrogenase
MRLENKAAIITGGGSGIGRAIAQRFLLEGAQVAIFDRDEAAAQETLEGHANGLALSVDVTQQADMVAGVAKVFSTFGRLDIIVNNAGIAHVGNLEKTTPEDMDRLFAVNVQGVYNGMFAALPALKANGGGVIINMGSVASSIGIPDRFAYSMTKGAVESMTYSVATDYVQDNIRCNSIAPGRVHTPFVDAFIAKNYPGQEEEMFGKLAASQPIGRMGEPSEIAGLAVYLCSDEASFITGTNYPIDGGFIHVKR